jgi:hypothetical protein
MDRFGGGALAAPLLRDEHVTYATDDIPAVRLNAGLVLAPPIELWPAVQTRVPVPGDVEAIVLAPLRADTVKPADGGTS